METKVLNLVTKISEQTQIIDKNNQELCRLTNDNLHLKSRLTQLEKKVFPKGDTTIQINCNNKVTHIIPQKNNQFIESEVIELKATKPNDTQRISPPHPSEKREGKTTPSSVNLKEKACVPCPFLKKRGHCLKGDKCDFLHKFTLPHKLQNKIPLESLILLMYHTQTIIL